MVLSSWQLKTVVSVLLVSASFALVQPSDKNTFCDPGYDRYLEERRELDDRGLDWSPKQNNRRVGERWENNWRLTGREDVTQDRLLRAEWHSGRQIKSERRGLVDEIGAVQLINANTRRDAEVVLENRVEQKKRIFRRETVPDLDETRIEAQEPRQQRDERFLESRSEVQVAEKSRRIESVRRDASSRTDRETVQDGGRRQERIPSTDRRERFNHGESRREDRRIESSVNRDSLPMTENRREVESSVRNSNSQRDVTSRSDREQQECDTIRDEGSREEESQDADRRERVNHETSQRAIPREDRRTESVRRDHRETSVKRFSRDARHSLPMTEDRREEPRSVRNLNEVPFRSDRERDTIRDEGRRQEETQTADRREREDRRSESVRGDISETSVNRFSVDTEDRRDERLSARNSNKRRDVSSRSDRKEQERDSVRDEGRRQEEIETTDRRERLNLEQSRRVIREDKRIESVRRDRRDSLSMAEDRRDERLSARNSNERRAVPSRSGSERKEPEVRPQEEIQTTHRREHANREESRRVISREDQRIESRHRDHYEISANPVSRDLSMAVDRLEERSFARNPNERRQVSSISDREQQERDTVRDEGSRQQDRQIADRRECLNREESRAMLVISREDRRIESVSGDRRETSVNRFSIDAPGALSTTVDRREEGLPPRISNERRVVPSRSDREQQDRETVRDEGRRRGEIAAADRRELHNREESRRIISSDDTRIESIRRDRRETSVNRFSTDARDSLPISVDEREDRLSIRNSNQHRYVLSRSRSEPKEREDRQQEETQTADRREREDRRSESIRGDISETSVNRFSVEEDRRDERLSNERRDVSSRSDRKEQERDAVRDEGRRQGEIETTDRRERVNREESRRVIRDDKRIESIRRDRRETSVNRFSTDTLDSLYMAEDRRDERLSARNSNERRDVSSRSDRKEQEREAVRDEARRQEEIQTTDRRERVNREELRRVISREDQRIESIHRDLYEISANRVSRDLSMAVDRLEERSLARNPIERRQVSSISDREQQERDTVRDEGSRQQDIQIADRRERVNREESRAMLVISREDRRIESVSGDRREISVNRFSIDVRDSLPLTRDRREERLSIRNASKRRDVLSRNDREHQELDTVRDEGRRREERQTADRREGVNREESRALHAISREDQRIVSLDRGRHETSDNRFSIDAPGAFSTTVDRREEGLPPRNSNERRVVPSRRDREQQDRETVRDEGRRRGEIAAADRRELLNREESKRVISRYDQRINSVRRDRRETSVNRFSTETRDSLPISVDEREDRLSIRNSNQHRYVLSRSKSERKEREDRRQEESQIADRRERVNREESRRVISREEYSQLKISEGGRHGQEQTERLTNQRSGVQDDIKKVVRSQENAYSNESVAVAKYAKSALITLIQAGLITIVTLKTLNLENTKLGYGALLKAKEFIGTIVT